MIHIETKYWNFWTWFREVSSGYGCVRHTFTVYTAIKHIW